MHSRQRLSEVHLEHPFKQATHTVVRLSKYPGRGAHLFDELTSLRKSIIALQDRHYPRLLQVKQS